MTSDERLRSVFLAGAAKGGAKGQWRMAMSAAEKVSANLFAGEATSGWSLAATVEVQVVPNPPTMQTDAPGEQTHAGAGKEMRWIDGKAFLSRQRGDPREHAQTLDEMVNALIVESNSKLELAILGRVEPGRNSWAMHDPISEAWLGVVGGLMPNEPMLREEMALRITQVRPGIGDLMQTWR